MVMLLPCLSLALQATILSQTDARFASGTQALARMNVYDVKRMHPPPFDSNETLNRWHINFERVHGTATSKFLKSLSNRMGFEAMLRDFAHKPAPGGEWHLFCEDDVDLHPDISGENATRMLPRLLNSAREDGLLMLGACDITWLSSPNRRSGGVRVTRGAGQCSHAFAATRWRAKELLLRMDETDGPRPFASIQYFDSLMKLACDPTVHGFMGSSSMIVSNYEYDRLTEGLLIQNRNRWATEIF